MKLKYTFPNGISALQSQLSHIMLYTALKQNIWKLPAPG